MGTDPKGITHMVPRHLRREKPSMPGPGTYQAASSIKKNTRKEQSAQDCTWQRSHQSSNTLPQSNPGPNHYDLEREKFRLAKDRCESNKDGFSFPKHGVDGKTDDAVARNVNPGPGSYAPQHSKSHIAKSMLGGKIGESKDYSNGVPGPGNYEPDHHYPIPSFKIEPAQSINQQKEDKRIGAAPGSYDPKHNFEFREEHNGVRFGTSTRAEVAGAQMVSPGPQTYQITGDFDFRDPSKPDQKTGKKPKFAFGMKFNTKPRNLDCPGPGEYETDQYPMNQKNISYWIGTDVRRDLSVPYSHLYPGPGHYEVDEQKQGPYIS